MAREGTRSSTGNSKPRVFPTIDTAPTVKRSRKSKTAGLLGGKADKGKATTVKAPPATDGAATIPGTTDGVAKKKGPAKTAGTLVTKAKTAVKKVEKKVAGTAKAPKKQAAAAAT